MLQAFIITLREGVEAALIVGITLAYLAKINRPDLRKSVYTALVSAFLGSIGIAVLLSHTQWNQDVFEGWIMLAAAFFVAMTILLSETLWKWRDRRRCQYSEVGLLARLPSIT